MPAPHIRPVPIPDPLDTLARILYDVALERVARLSAQAPNSVPSLGKEQPNGRPSRDQLTPVAAAV